MHITFRRIKQHVYVSTDTDLHVKTTYMSTYYCVRVWHAIQRRAIFITLPLLRQSVITT